MYVAASATPCHAALAPFVTAVLASPAAWVSAPAACVTAPATPFHAVPARFATVPLAVAAPFAKVPSIAVTVAFQLRAGGGSGAGCRAPGRPARSWTNRSDLSTSPSTDTEGDKLGETCSESPTDSGDPGGEVDDNWALRGPCLPTLRGCDCARATRASC